MTNLETAIIGVLSGSLGGALVTKILDIIQKGREHKMELQRSFFASKLKAAEDITADLTKSLTMIQQLRVLYSLMKDHIGKGELHELKQMLAEYMFNWIKTNMPGEGSLRAAGLYNLYFKNQTAETLAQQGSPLNLFLGDLGPALSAVLQFDPAAYADPVAAEQEYGARISAAKALIDEIIDTYEVGAEEVQARLDLLNEYYAEKKYLK